RKRRRLGQTVNRAAINRRPFSARLQTAAPGGARLPPRRTIGSNQPRPRSTADRLRGALVRSSAIAWRQRADASDCLIRSSATHCAHSLTLWAGEIGFLLLLFSRFLYMLAQKCAADIACAAVSLTLIRGKNSFFCIARSLLESDDDVSV